MYFDTKRKKRQTESQLKRRGLIKTEINLEDIGIIPLLDTHPIDTDLYIAVDTGQVEIKDDKAHVVYEKQNKTCHNIRRIMKNKVNERRDQILTSGIEFTFAGAGHTLQTRDVEDLINWTNILTTAKELPVETLVKIRTAADLTPKIPAGQIMALITAAMACRIKVLDRSWSLKDDIDQATTDDNAFTAYEAGIDTVWPDDSAITL
jgi:hypothetical protein